ncbi:MAG: alpha-L-fucosidase [Lentisphaeria bacterium]|nr:alpha-L-fucosidase [Lentisphaeria bacterium]
MENNPMAGQGWICVVALAGACSLAAAGTEKGGGTVTDTRILHPVFESVTLKTPKRYSVVLPRNYYAEPTRVWPVLFLFHGRGRHERSLIEDNGTRAALLAAPFVTILPDGDDGWYINSPSRTRDRYADYMVELVAHCDRTYRVSRERRFRALSGWSMGGYGCTLFASAHPHEFGVLAPMIGLLDFPRGGLPKGQSYNVPTDRFTAQPNVWDSLNPLRKAEALRHTRILLQSGTTAFDRTMNENFHHRLDELGITHQFELLKGGHTFSVVRTAVSRVVTFVSGCFEEAGTMKRGTWFHDASYGVMIHFLGGGDDWNDTVEAFDVPAFALQMKSAGAGYVLFTLGQNSGYYCAPNAVYDRITGNAPGTRCSRRDLPAELATELGQHGIRLLLYLPSRAPQRDTRAMAALGDVSEREPAPQPFTKNWSAVIREWSERYGNRVWGWWFDGAYSREGWDDLTAEASWRTWAAACRAGNPESILAFNPGTRRDLAFASLTDEQDYTAGEQNQFEVTPVSLPCPDGLIWQILCPLGSTWSKPDGPQLSDKAMIDYVRRVNAEGGVVTFDVAHRLGQVYEPHLAQLRHLATAQLHDQR